ncbi:MAG: J domain-containing protein [Spirochaetia bacterium]
MTGRIEQVKALAGYIRYKSGDSGEWRISIPEAARVTLRSPLDFYEAAFRIGPKLGITGWSDGFSPENAGFLTAVLEDLYGSAVEEVLYREGVFLPQHKAADLSALLIEEAYQESRRQGVREEDFRQFLDRTGDFEQAADLYVREHFRIQDMVRTVSERFVRREETDLFGTVTCRCYLEDCMARKIFTLRNLLAWAFMEMEDLAEKIGHFFTDEQGRFEDSGLFSGSSQIDSAASELGLRSTGLNRNQVKKRYRELMRQYHPDVNPKGLDRCKRITRAYSILITKLPE